MRWWAMCLLVVASSAEARFGLPALTARDANALPPYEMFDFGSPPFVTPPAITAHTTVPASILSACGQAPAPTCPQPP